MAAVRDGNDREQLRHAESLVPVESPPFYAAEHGPVITNTQGGPEHDSHRQVLDAWGKPNTPPGLIRPASSVRFSEISMRIWVTLANFKWSHRRESRRQ